MKANRLCAAVAAASALAATPVAGEPAAPAASGRGWREQQLIDLAEVLGRAHYLRVICVGRTDQRWRDYMRTVLDREPRLRRALSDSFNDGYRDEAVRFPDCSVHSRTVEQEVRARGVRIASALAAPGADAGGDHE
jgi:uncharacterized protein (TIGR02301 family)